MVSDTDFKSEIRLIFNKNGNTNIDYGIGGGNYKSFDKKDLSKATNVSGIIGINLTYDKSDLAEVKFNNAFDLGHIIPPNNTNMEIRRVGYFISQDTYKDSNNIDFHIAIYVDMETGEVLPPQNYVFDNYNFREHLKYTSRILAGKIGFNISNEVSEAILTKLFEDSDFEEDYKLLNGEHEKLKNSKVTNLSNTPFNLIDKNAPENTDILSTNRNDIEEASIRIEKKLQKSLEKYRDKYIKTPQTTKSRDELKSPTPAKRENFGNLGASADDYEKKTETNNNPALSTRRELNDIAIPSKTKNNNTFGAVGIKIDCNEDRFKGLTVALHNSKSNNYINDKNVSKDKISNIFNNDKTVEDDDFLTDDYKHSLITKRTGNDIKFFLNPLPNDIVRIDIGDGICAEFHYDKEGKLENGCSFVGVDLLINSRKEGSNLINDFGTYNGVSEEQVKKALDKIGSFTSKTVAGEWNGGQKDINIKALIDKQIYGIEEKEKNKDNFTKKEENKEKNNSDIDKINPTKLFY